MQTKITISFFLFAFIWIACGAPEPIPCDIPNTDAIIFETLEGSWNVYEQTNLVIGTMLFDGDSIETFSNDVIYNGTWSLSERRVNGYTFVFAFSEAEENGVREVFASPITFSLTLVFANYDELYALESEGAWSRWQRTEEVNKTEQ